jgi:hypothetical protein
MYHTTTTIPQQNSINHNILSNYEAKRHYAWADSSIGVYIHRTNIDWTSLTIPDLTITDTLTLTNSGTPVDHLQFLFSGNVDYITAGQSAADATAEIKIARYGTTGVSINQFGVLATSSWFSGLVGIGSTGFDTSAPINTLDVSGGSAVGAGYAGTYTAPSDGLLVKGAVAIGTTGALSKLDVSGSVAIGAAYANTAAAPANGLLVSGTAGFGTSTPQSKVSVSGGLGVGATYAGTTAAPTNGAIIEGAVAIGSSATNGKLNVFDSTQLAARIVLSGQEFYQAANTSTNGPCFVVGVNRSGNRQLWIADSAALTQNTTNGALKLAPSVSINYIQSLATDGNTPLPLEIGVSAAGGNLNLKGDRIALTTSQSVSSGTAYGANLSATLTQTAAATLNGLQVVPVFTVTGAITATQLAIQTLSNTIANASGTVTAFYGQKTNLTTAGATTSAYGSYTLVTHTAAGVCANQYGVYADVNTTTTGTVTNSYGGYFNNPTAGGTANVALYSTNLSVGYTGTSPPASGAIISGNVGIGTNAPQGKLDVAGGLSLGAYAGVTGAASGYIIMPGQLMINTTTTIAGSAIVINNPASSSCIVITQGTAGNSNSMRFTNGTDNFYIGQDGVGLAGFSARAAILATWSAMPMILATNATERIRILSGGNVGVGTTVPASKLSISGGLCVGATYAGTTAAPTNGATFEGQVGIGTAAPTGAAKLDVSSGNIYITGSGTTTYGLYTGGWGGNFDIKATADNHIMTIASGSSAGQVSSIVISATSAASNAGTIIFNTANTERVRINTSGLGIGATPSPASLTVTTGKSVGAAGTSYGVLCDVTHTATASTVTAMYGCAINPTYTTSASGFNVTAVASLSVNATYNGTAGTITDAIGLNVAAGTYSGSPVITTATGAKIALPAQSTNSVVYGINTSGSATVTNSSYVFYNNASLTTATASKNIAGIYNSPTLNVTGSGVAANIVYGIANLQSTTVSAITSPSIYGVNNTPTITITAGSTGTNVYAFASQPIVSNTTTATTNLSVYAAYIQPILTTLASGTVTTMTSAYFSSAGTIVASTGTFSELAGVKVEHGVANSSTIAVSYGVYVKAGSTAGTVTTAYGGYFTTPNAGTAKTALYADNLSVGYTATTPPASGLIVSGAVGIGTTSPASKLDVEGGVAIGATYSGTTAAPTNGAIIEGVVGIGTAAPAASALLDLTSTTKVFLPPRMTTAERNAVSSPATGSLVYDTDLTSLYSYNGSGWSAVGGAGGSYVALAGDTMTGQLTISMADGGINDFGYVNLLSTTAFSQDVGAAITFGGYYSGVARQYFAGIRGDKENGTSGNIAGVLKLTTTDAAGTLSERVRITSAGYLGVGTTAPASKLSVSGNLCIGATYAGTTAAPTNGAIIEGLVGIGVTNPSRPLSVKDTDNSTAQLCLMNSTTTGTNAYMGSFANGVYLSVGGKFVGGWSYDSNNYPVPVFNMLTESGNSYMTWNTTSSNGTPGSERMRLTAAGYLGIGTTIPYHLVQINGVLKVGGDVGQQTGSIVLGDDLSSAQYNGLYRGAASGAVGGANNVWVSGYDGAGINTGAFAFGASKVVGLFCKPDGTNGIGTTAPFHKAQINGVLKVASAASTGTIALGDDAGTELYNGIYRGATTGAVGGANNVWVSGYDGAGINTGAFQFGTSKVVGLFCKPDGTNGVGTTAPGSRLDVRGNLKIGGDSPLNQGLEIYGDSAHTGGTGFLGFDDTNNYLRIGSYKSAAWQNITFNDAGGGNIGMGTTSPVSKLSISGGLGVGATYAGTTAAPTNGAIIEGVVGIGTAAPASSALLDLTSTTKVFLPPRMTSAEKAAVSSPATGAVVYDTTLSRVSQYTGSKWVQLAPTGFEAINQNLDDFPYAISYDGSSRVSTVTYTAVGGNIVKTFSYDGSSNISTIVLSGSGLPAGVLTTKTYTYTTGVLTSVAYS